MPGYAVTAYASQGKTVDTVLAAYTEGETTQVSANRNQWYVTISRARRKALVFTEDKEALCLRVDRETDRAPALSVAPEQATVVATCAKFSEETLRLLRMAAQVQRNEEVMRWIRAAQQIAPAPKIAATPPPLPEQNITQHTTIRRMRL